MPQPPFRLVFMGTPEFAVPCLRHLLEVKQDIVAVYTQPPRPAGRGHKLQQSPVHSLAERYGIPVYTPASLKSPEVQEQFRAHCADAAIVAAYGLLLPQPVLEAYPMGCINVHPSRLPRWRGAAPIQRTIMAGDSSTALCIMQMAQGLDTGDILWQQDILINPETTTSELHDQIAQMAGSAVMETLIGLRNHVITPRLQSVEGITYARKILKEEAIINWNKPADEVLHHIHGLSSYPGAYFCFQNEKIKILKAMQYPPLQLSSSPPGYVLDAQLTISCNPGAIRPLIVQRPGKKPMLLEEMLRGFIIPSGTRLG